MNKKDLLNINIKEINNYISKYIIGDVEIQPNISPEDALKQLLSISKRCSLEVFFIFYIKRILIQLEKELFRVFMNMLILH